MVLKVAVGRLHYSVLKSQQKGCQELQLGVAIVRRSELVVAPLIITPEHKSRISLGSNLHCRNRKGEKLLHNVLRTKLEFQVAHRRP